VEYGFLMEKNTGSKPQFLNSEYKNTHMKKKENCFIFLQSISLGCNKLLTSYKIFYTTVTVHIKMHCI